MSGYRAELIKPYGTSPAHIAPAHYRRDSPLSRRGNRLNIHGWAFVVKRVISDFVYDTMIDRAAALTYYTVLSLTPTIVAFYSLAMLLLPTDKDAVSAIFVDAVQNYVPVDLRNQALSVLETVVGTTSQNTIALLVSVLISLLSASAYVRSFSRNANVIYGRVEGRSLPMAWLSMWLVTIVLVLGAVVLLFAAILQESLVTGLLSPVAGPLGLTGVVEYLTSIFLPVWRWVRIPVMIAVAVLLVALLYYFTPNVRPGRFRLLTIGSFLVLVVIGLIWLLFRVFLNMIGINSAYGAFGTVLAMLVLVWVTNIVLLVGVKIDAEVLRAKELQLGLESNDLIQAPPRSAKALRLQLRLRRWADRSAEKIKGRNAPDNT